MGGAKSKKRGEGGREEKTGEGTAEASRGREMSKKGSREEIKGRGGMAETKRSGRRLLSGSRLTGGGRTGAAKELVEDNESGTSGVSSV